MSEKKVWYEWRIFVYGSPTNPVFSNRKDAWSVRRGWELVDQENAVKSPKMVVAKVKMVRV